MIKIHPDDMPFPSTPRIAAEYLKKRGAEMGADLKGEFNSSPMTAFRSDTVDQIVMRFHYERVLLWIANGEEDARKYADPDYVR